MAQSTISQRIALEGAEDIIKQLGNVGKAAEQLRDQIQASTTGMSAGLGGLSNISALAQSEFAKVSAALGPVRANFAALEEAAKGVVEHIVEVAKVLGVGLVGGIAGGIAGFVELIKSSAEAGHQLEVQAGTLGLTVEQLQAYRKVAAEAGVDGDRVFTALTKLTQNLGKETEKLSADSIKILADLPAAMSTAGAGVLRGPTLPQAGTGRGIVDAAAIGEAKQAVDDFTAQAIKAAEQQGKTFSPAEVERYRQSIIATQGNVGKLGETFRLAAAAAGVPFPALTQSEELKRNAEIAADPVLRLGVSLKDLQNAGELLDPVIRKILDGLAGISDPAQKNQIALALLGRSAKELSEAFKGGSGSLDAALASLHASGLGLSPEQAALLAEAEKDFVRLGGAATGLRNQLAVIFAPALIDVTKTFTDLIKNNADTFKDWARVIASDVLPGIANLIQQFTGAGEAAKGVMPGAPGAAPLPSVVTGKTGVGHVQFPQVPDIPSTPSTTAVGATEPPPVSVDPEGARKSLEALRDTAIAVGTAIATAFMTIRSVLDTVAALINSVFGTMLKASGLAAILVIGTLSGAFAILLPAIALVASVIAALATPIGTVAALVVAFGATLVHFWPQISAGFKIASDAIKAAAVAVGEGISGAFSASITLVEGLWNGLVDWVKGAISTIAGIVSAVGSAISTAFNNAISLVEEAFNGLVNWVSGVAQSILGFLQPVLDFIGKIASGLAGLVSGGGGAVSGGSGGSGLGLDSVGAPSLAAGGRVPGGPSGTDTVPAWLTPGEFVNSRSAVQHYGVGLFHALNNLRLPFDAIRGFSLGGMVGSAMEAFAPSPSPLMLAAGGAVFAPAGGGGGPMHSLTLNLSGQNFALDVAPGAVFDKLARHARSSAITSAGRKPSWFAS